MRDPFGGGGYGKRRGTIPVVARQTYIIIISNSDKGRTLETSTLRLLTVAELCYQHS